MFFFRICSGRIDMPLKLSLARGEKIIVNGAVIRNDGDHTDLVFENQSYILRQKDILTTETAATPASRIYFALQCAYLFPEKAENYLDIFTDLLNDYLEAAPSAQVIATEILTKVDTGQLYQSLKYCTQLIRHEHKAFSHVA
jgi:flagellar protein FlbT